MRMRPLMILAALGAATAGPALAQAGRAGGMAAMLAAMDSNGDGAISMAEAKAARERLFDRIDVNKDGVVAAAELKAAHDALAARRIDKGNMAPGGDDGPMLRAFDRFDANGDGKTTKAEALAAPYLLFERFDANKNGVIEQSEMPGLGQN
jgi:Ca2+-binding EF-hand superfamily protein